MNAGKSYTKAKAQAQANADYSNSPRWLHQYGGVWWISKEAGAGGRERIDPRRSRRAPTRDPKYGDKRDYPKIEIFVDGDYRATTTWARTLDEARRKFAEATGTPLHQIRAHYKEPRSRKTRRDNGREDGGYHVMTYGGGRYTSVSWHPDKASAEREVRRIKDAGAWRGMPPKIERGQSWRERGVPRRDPRRRRRRS